MQTFERCIAALGRMPYMFGTVDVYVYNLDAELLRFYWNDNAQECYVQAFYRFNSCACFRFQFDAAFGWYHKQVYRNGEYSL